MALEVGPSTEGGSRRPKIWIVPVLTFVVALAFALVLRRKAFVALALLALLMVPLEVVFPLRRGQKLFRPGFLTDLTHYLLSATLIAVCTVAAVTVVSLPLIPLRDLDLEARLPSWVAAALVVVVFMAGNYWGHRLTHEIPLLWRFHAVHHSIEQMDWMASNRLHPLDTTFAQVCTIVPMVALGYSGEAIVPVAVFITVVVAFQHANTRLRFPILRWIIPTPEWHHWHHAVDRDAHDKNYGFPIVDKLFGTAFLPPDRRPSGFGVPDPVPGRNYLGQLWYPFRAR
jgi:sterol desaturase/sphingolipid hydroxylase (fatty acid hydroxylase superfamily)